MEKLIFVHWFVQVNRQKTTVNNLFFAYVASLSTIFEKSLQFANFLLPLGV